MKLIAAALVALVLATPAAGPVDYVLSRQQSDGGFAEPRAQSDPGLTAWAVLGLASFDRAPKSAADYLAGKPYRQATDLALRILALEALDQDTSRLADQLETLRRTDGRIGPLVNSTIWGARALQAAGRRNSDGTVRYLLRQQRPSGGWSWYPGGRADSNDTAAALETLLALRIPPRSAPIRRGVAFLQRLQRGDGGFPLLPGRAPDAQSTAWALRTPLGKRASERGHRYLRSLRRADGSYRYSRRLGITPTWVTAQVLPALAARRKP